MTNQPEPAVGIDLGTTYSVIAQLDGEGRPRTIANMEGDLTTPSVIYFYENTAVVGKEAVKVAAFEPDSIAEFVKREIGRSEFSREIHGHKIPPEVLQALILRKLKEDALLQMSDVFRKVVITVPAFFNEPRRKATMDAGRLAGLTVLDIINEPTAAAIAYGVQGGFINAAGAVEGSEVVVVYDLGGGTFDVSVMEITGNHYEALATAGDVYLGGVDWDNRLIDHLAAQFIKQHQVDPREDAAAMNQLRREAKDAKHSLTSRDSVTARFSHQGQSMVAKISRSEFEQDTSDLVQRTIFTVNKTLKAAGKAWGDVTRLLLVGGSSRMPMIQEALEEASGLKVDRSLSPDEAVAHGAALYAGFLLGGDGKNRPTMSIVNVNSHDLGVLAVERQTGMNRRQVLIARNTKLPAEGAGVFATAKENQSNVQVKVIEGGDASGKNATVIGNCIVNDLPKGLPAQTPVEVLFHYEANGRLLVTASLPSFEKSVEMIIHRTDGLTEEELKHWSQRIESGAVLQEIDASGGPAASASDLTPEANAQGDAFDDDLLADLEKDFE